MGALKPGSVPFYSLSQERNRGTTSESTCSTPGSQGTSTGLTFRTSGVPRKDPTGSPGDSGTPRPTLVFTLVYDGGCRGWDKESETGVIKGEMFRGTEGRDRRETGSPTTSLQENRQDPGFQSRVVGLLSPRQRCRPFVLVIGDRRVSDSAPVGAVTRGFEGIPI